MSLVDAMMRPETYDERVERVRMIQTHISWVFLTGKFAYKVKKPVDFGFLDFTTLEKRKHYCEEEVRLNSRFSPEMYLGVLPIVRSDGGFRVNGRGEAMEYAVKTLEMPQDALLSNRLRDGRVTGDMIADIAKVVADFHRRAETGGEINEGGSTRTIAFNWKENFEQTRDFVGTTLPRGQYEFISERVNAFISGNSSLFEARVKGGRIRDCHGDLHSQSIFITDRVFLFDCIEFNTRFRYSDVAAEVAYLAMDLDYHGRGDLSERFVSSYLSFNPDAEMLLLLPFYQCYRAYVKGKVTSFKLSDGRVGQAERDAARESARAYFDLSSRYARLL
jgi:hypothetical protein